jgi:hypothetical protein
MERWICLACVLDVFTRHMGLAPKTAHVEVKRYTPPVAELYASPATRPYFDRQSPKDPCPYCGSASKWQARLRVYRIESGQYDLEIREEYQREPIVSLTGQKNVMNEPGSMLDRYSFVSNPFGNDSNALFYVDDVRIATDAGTPPGAFVAPGLYAVHALLSGLAYFLCVELGIRHGFTFSHGLIDYIVLFPKSHHALWLFVIGPIWALFYYGIFTFAIRKFNLATPGREAEDELTKASRSADKKWNATPETGPTK